jgi:hypothetical protein
VQGQALPCEFSKSGEGEQFAQIDRLAALVRQFDADGITARHHRDAGGNCAHERAMSSASPITRDDLMPGAGSSS